MSRRYVALLALFMSSLILVTADTATASVRSTDPSMAGSPTTLTDDLAALWTTVLQTPSAQNPFGSGGQQYACLDIGNTTIAPFSPDSVKSCRLPAGASLFVVAGSQECSTFEGTAVTQLRSCAIQADLAQRPAIAVDGVAVPVRQVQTGQLSIVLPSDNIFGLPAGATGYSAAHGWVALVSPLPSGRHTVVITTSSGTITTRITVG